jgi:hypothetical protein
MFWKDNNDIEVVMADDKPFSTCNNVDAMLYGKNVGIMQHAGLKNGKPNLVVEQSLMTEDVATSSEANSKWPIKALFEPEKE